jgi:[1-hydroxy-2-(trimethylamino)ethyl]phosphonate dioxygenase
MDIVDQILELFQARGAAAYLGEPVSQTEHALQAAHLAVREDAAEALVTAALLHDIGHLLGPEDDPAERGIDAVHEDRGCAWLAPHFGPEVTEPIRLHVMAKRYLCAVDAAYRELLSPASIHSLELQGGALNSAEAEGFERNSHAAGAIRLRRWDDRAKIPNLEVPELGHYTATLRRLTLRK